MINLTINPGSTSTKYALYENDKEIFSNSITHKVEELNKFKSIIEQKDYRANLIIDDIIRMNKNLYEIDNVIGRGGLLNPLESGVYEVNDRIIEDLSNAKNGEHASNLGAIIAKQIAKEANAKAYIADPVSVDEFSEVARLSGLDKIPRVSMLHALNIKAMSKRAARELNFNLSDKNLIVAHLGGGISIAPIEKNKILDVNNANESGPFSVERTGQLPNWSVIDLAFDNPDVDFKELRKNISGKGGIISYLGESDFRKVMDKFDSDEYVRNVVKAQAYQIGKEIGAMATVIKGNVDYIIITGGQAYNDTFVNLIKDRINFITKDIIIMPGENELEALNESVLYMKKDDLKVYR